jgi:response regulator RpfG family c-di-GMP phosphodiesterase
LLHKCVWSTDGLETIHIAKDIIDSKFSTVANSLTKVSIRPISLMLLDLQMPKKNGIEVVKWVEWYCKELRKNLVTVQPPLFVFHSAYFTNMSQRQLESLGIKHYFEKPMNIQQLQDVVSKSRKGSAI